MSHFIESLSPEKRQALEDAPFTRYFFFLTDQTELAETPRSQYTDALQDLASNLNARLGRDWQERYITMARRFDNSLQALSAQLSKDQKEDMMTRVSLMGFELGSEKVGLFIEDVYSILRNRNILNTTPKIDPNSSNPILEMYHAQKVGHDFVEAVMRIGADIRNYPVIHDATPTNPEEPFDWRMIPPDLP